MSKQNKEKPDLLLEAGRVAWGFMFFIICACLFTLLMKMNLSRAIVTSFGFTAISMFLIFEYEKITEYLSKIVLITGILKSVILPFIAGFLLTPGTFLTFSMSGFDSKNLIQSYFGMINRLTDEKNNPYPNISGGFASLGLVFGLIVSLIFVVSLLIAAVK
jgi:hypothetical protein